MLRGLPLRGLHRLQVLLVQIRGQLRVAQYGVLEAAYRSQAGQTVLIESGEVVDEAASRAVGADTVAGKVDTLLGLHKH